MCQDKQLGGHYKDKVPDILTEQVMALNHGTTSRVRMMMDLSRKSEMKVCAHQNPDADIQESDRKETFFITGRL